MICMLVNSGDSFSDDCECGDDDDYDYSDNNVEDVDNFETYKHGESLLVD